MDIELTEAQLAAMATIAGEPNQEPTFAPADHPYIPTASAFRPSRRRSWHAVMPTAVLALQHGEAVLGELVAMGLVVRVKGPDDPVEIVTFTPLGAYRMRRELVERISVNRGVLEERPYWDHVGANERRPTIIPRRVQAYEIETHRTMPADVGGKRKPGKRRKAKQKAG